MSKKQTPITDKQFAEYAANHTGELAAIIGGYLAVSFVSGVFARLIFNRIVESRTRYYL